MAEQKPTASPEKPSTETPPRRIVSAGVSAALVYWINDLFKDPADSETRKLLAPAAAVVGLLVGEVLAAVYLFVVRFIGNEADNWIKDRNLWRGARRNIRELKREARSLKRSSLYADKKRLRAVQAEIRSLEQLIRDSRVRSLNLLSTPAINPANSNTSLPASDGSTPT